MGRIILSSLDFLKPELSKPLTKPDLTLENMKRDDQVVVPNPDKKKAAPLKGFQHFQKVCVVCISIAYDLKTGVKYGFIWLFPFLIVMC